MQNYIIETDENGLELNTHGDSLFPLAGYDEYFSQFVLKEVPWHWHEEIELIIVVEGSTKVEYVDGSLELQEGDGVFINSNILHRLTQTSTIDCHVINFVLKPDFLSGRLDSRIYTKFIKPICSNKSLSAIKFSPKSAWEQQVIEKINFTFTAYAHQNFGYELSVKSNLLDAWRILCTYQPNLFKQTSPVTENKVRLDKIIKFIHRNYDRKLSIKQLATVADISESECYRIFRKTLHTTPNDYILNHRLQIAAIKLVESDQSILNISYDIGFGNPSYFSKKFKEQYGNTPKEFRKAHLKNE
jgi:AraC-like DNA-binding protein/mannose-6-phosphate isomerase-like protein (cupin superfamily)